MRIRPSADFVGVLRTRKTSIGRSGRISRHLRPLFIFGCDHLGEPSPYIPAGLLPIAVRAIERWGLTPTCTGTSPEILPEPDHASLGRHFDPVDRAVIDHVRAHDDGLMVIDRHRVCVASLIAQIALAWPTRTVAVIVTTRSIAMRIGDVVRRVVPGVAVVTGRDPWQRPSRVTIATAGSLGMVDISNVQTVIVPHAVFALRTNVATRLADAGRARVYGFLDRGQAVSPYEQDQLIATFGLRSVHIPRHGAVAMPVSYGFFGIGSAPSIDIRATDIQIRRDGVWRNDMRNRLIARIADACATGGDGTMAMLPELPEAWRDCRPRFVCVLVDGIAHAQRIARRLRWPIIVGGSADLDGIPPRRSPILRVGVDIDPGKIERAVVTTMGTQGIDLAGLDMLIRADGGVGMPPLVSNEPAPVSWDQAWPLVVVDIEDRGHPVLRRWTRDRRDAYNAAGWTPLGVNPLDHAADRFLHTPPRVEEDDS